MMLNLGWVHHPRQTTESYLVLITVEYNAEEVPYQTPPLATNAARHFLPGAGEALPLQSLSLRLDGVTRIEGTLLRYVLGIPLSSAPAICSLCSVSPRKDYILFSTGSPPSIQRVPWPSVDGEGGNAGGGYDTWVVNEEEFPWLVDADGMFLTSVHSVAGAQDYRSIRCADFIPPPDGI